MTKRLSFILFFMMWSLALNAESEPWRVSYHRGIKLADLGRERDAIPLLNRALDNSKNRLGSSHPMVSQIMFSLANLYQSQGAMIEAESLHKLALKLRKDFFGLVHPDTAQSLHQLAEVYQTTGRPLEAEPLFRQALEVREDIFGSYHIETAQSLEKLAMILKELGRIAEAERYQKRALEVIEKILGDQHPLFAENLGNLADLYKSQKRYEKASELHEKALRIHEQVFGPNHIATSESLEDLGLIYSLQQNYAKAVPLLQRALDIRLRELPGDHPALHDAFNNLGHVFLSMGHFDEAERSYAAALKVLKESPVPDTSNIARTLYNFSGLYMRLGDYREALTYIRQAAVTYRKTPESFIENRPYLDRTRQLRYDLFFRYIEIIASLLDSRQEDSELLIAEAFETAQSIRTSTSEISITHMAARSALSQEEWGVFFQPAIRAQQDAVEELWRTYRILINETQQPIDKRDQLTEERLRARIVGLRFRISTLTNTLESRFADFDDLSAPRQVSAVQVQRLLLRNEALLLYLIQDKGAYLFIIEGDRIQMVRLKTSPSNLEDVVSRIRASVDPNLSGRYRKRDLLNFPIPACHELYEQLIKPVESLLNGVQHIFLILDGPLQRIPFQILVGESYNDRPKTFADYRNVPWLVKRYSMSVLPSVASLKILRDVIEPSSANRPFLGIGDPLLADHPGMEKTLSDNGSSVKEHAADPYSHTLFRRLAIQYNGRGFVSAARLRTLPSIPETARELTTIAQILGASSRDLYLRERATESMVKGYEDISVVPRPHELLLQYRIIAFASHALVAGEFAELAESAIVLTPPRDSSLRDDGLLTATEISQLHLDADWVILSACNTAAGAGKDTEGLSGLAKAFFHAGSRKLFVSHWRTPSEATVKLTTTMLNILANHHELGAGAGHRLAMLSLIYDLDKPEYAHPLFWAPFVIVGDGGFSTSKQR